MSRSINLPTQAVVVLLGGPSAEHDVSLVSGRAVAAALAERGHGLTGWLIDLDGGWWQLRAESMEPSLPPSAYDDPAALGADGPHDPSSALGAIRGLQARPVVFPVLHGPFGEDGTIQALLESAELVYCGAGVAASAVGMDKAIFKRVCAGVSLPVVPWMSLARSGFEKTREGTLRRIEAFSRSLPSPQLVIKPARLGSSIGVSIVRRPSEPPELEFAIADAFRFDDTLLAEAYVPEARELEAGLMGNDEGDLEVFGPGEILSGREFYDYEAKYRDSASRTVVAPDIEPDVRARAREIARAAFVAIGGQGFARADFLLSGDGALYLSEINTIPGFTPISLFPMLTAEGGYDFGDACERIVQLAIERAVASRSRRLTRADLP